MDECKQEEKNFQYKERFVPRLFKLTMDKYVKMIKTHISKSDLNSVLEMLDFIMENRDKSTLYLFSLLTRVFADIKQCCTVCTTSRTAYNRMATVTNLFNACALAENHEVALEHLNDLRQSLHKQQFLLGEINYKVMMKAYC